MSSSSRDHATTDVAQDGAGAAELKQRIRELEAALHPFAAYGQAATAYGLVHRGSLPPENKSLAYVQTEMRDSANVTWGDFALACRVMPKARYGGESAAKRFERMTRSRP